MASLQTPAIISATPPNAAAKPNAPAPSDGGGDFASMLMGVTTQATNATPPANDSSDDGDCGDKATAKNTAPGAPGITTMDPAAITVATAQQPPAIVQTPDLPQTPAAAAPAQDAAIPVADANQTQTADPGNGDDAAQPGETAPAAPSPARATTSPHRAATVQSRAQPSAPPQPDTKVQTAPSPDATQAAQAQAQVQAQPASPPPVTAAQGDASGQTVEASAPAAQAQQAAGTADKNTAPGNSKPTRVAAAMPSIATGAATDAKADTVSGSDTSKDANAPADVKAAGRNDGHSDSQDRTASDKPDPPQVSDATPAASVQPPQPAPAPAANPAAIAAATPAAPTHAAAVSAAVTVTVHNAPATPNANALAVDIAARSQSGAKQFQIRLDPPELGHVEVRLSIDANGKTEAHMTADQPQTLHLLQKDSDSLTRALRDAGLDVANGSLNFSLKGQDRQGGEDRNFAQPRTPALALTATKTIDAAQSANAYLSSSGDARLDIHV